MEVIRVENLSKLYDLGQVGTGTLSKDLNRWWAKMHGKQDPYARIGLVNDRTKKAEPNDAVWAIKDINFSINQGDVVGIIGRNGAGKSTLLKIISRITTPTTGAVKIRGRIASLLEVGTGFHPEMTGRENIFMNGTFLGMTRREIQIKLEEIVDFAGVEMYIDTPVKRYSSGMQVRLAFAVGAFLEPEILIVDEVLAVGDAEFQKKAIGKMQDVSKGKGRTVLFVSHNMGSVRQLCNKGILLKNGAIAINDSVENAIDAYFNSGERDGSGKPDVSTYRDRDVSQSEVVITDIFLENYENEIPELSMHANMKIVIRVSSLHNVSNANLSFTFSNNEGINLGGGFSLDNDVMINLVNGINDIIIMIDDLNFSPGKFYIGVGINKSTQTSAWDIIKYYPVFSIVNNKQFLYYPDRPWGVVHYNVKWQTKIP